MWNDVPLLNYAFYALMISYAEVVNLDPRRDDLFLSFLFPLTVPVVLYCLFRYLYLLHRFELGGSPTRALLTDRPLLVCVLLWVAVAAAVIGIG